MLGIPSLGIGPSLGRKLIWTPAMIPGIQSAGLWLDPSLLSTGFQVANGSTRQTASAQPTGLRLDRRLGTTSLPITGWEHTSGDGVVTVDGNQITITGATTTTRVDISPSGWSLGDLATIDITASVGSAVGATAFIGGGVSPNLVEGFGSYSGVIAASTLCRVQVSSGSATFIVTARSKTSGNHLVQATAGSRPTYTVSGGVAMDNFDGSDDQYGTATFSAGALTADMDCFIALRRIGDTDGVPVRLGLSAIFACYQTSASRPDVAVGTPTYLVDGADVAATRTELKAAITQDQWHIVEVRNLDLSAWTSLSISGFTALFITGDVGGLILCPAQDDDTRARIRSWLGAKVGLSL